MSIGPIDFFTLTREECLHRLRGEAVGRVVLTVRALPAALPVNYRLVGDDIVFATGDEAIQLAAVAGTVVAFEVDNVRRSTGVAWSVLAVGRSRIIADITEVDPVERAELISWLPGPVHHVAVHAELLSGRRLRPASRPVIRPAFPPDR